MHKKLIMACMAIAAFAAFVVAPAASASPVLTSGGSSVPVGTSVTGKNTGNTVFSGGFNVTCSTADLKGTVTANTGTTVAGTVAANTAEFTGTGSGGDCTSALGDVKVTVNSELCFDTIKGTDNVTIDGCEVETSPGVKTTEAITFTLHVTSLGLSCAYSTSTVLGTYVTSAAATVNLNAQAATRQAGQSGFCPANGSLTMDFDLYTTDGTLLQVS